MDEKQLTELMDDIDNNEVASIKSKISDEMKLQLLNAIDVRRKAKIERVTEE